MKKIMKKFSCYLLVLVMLASCITVNTFAADVESTMIEFVDVAAEGDAPAKLQAKTMFKNISSENAKGTLMVASYVNDVLVNVDCATSKELAPGAEDMLIAEIAKTDGAEYKAFVWDGTDLSPAAAIATTTFSGELLTDITIDGVSMSEYAHDPQNFDAATNTYNLYIPGGSVVPVVKGVVNTADSSIFTKTIYNVNGPTAVATVTATSGNVTKTYTLNFSAVVENNDFHSVVMETENGYIDGRDPAFWSGTMSAEAVAETPMLVTPKWYPFEYDGILRKNLSDGANLTSDSRYSVEAGYTTDVVEDDLVGCDYFAVPVSTSDDPKNDMIKPANSDYNYIMKFNINKDSKIIILSRTGKAYEGFDYIGNSLKIGAFLNNSSGGIVWGYCARYEKEVQVPEGAEVAEVVIPVHTAEAATDVDAPMIVIAPPSIKDLVPHISDFKNHVGNKTWTQYWAYNHDVSEAEAPAEPTRDAYGAAGGVGQIPANVGQYGATFMQLENSLSDNSSGKLLHGSSSATQFVLEDISDASGLADGYYLQQSSYFIPWFGNYADWVYEAFWVPEANQEKAWKPWYTFKVNAPCEVKILFNKGYESVGFCEQYGWTKCDLTESVYTGGRWDGSAYGSMENALMYTKKFSKGDIVELYSMYNSPQRANIGVNTAVPYMTIVEF